MSRVGTGQLALQVQQLPLKLPRQVQCQMWSLRRLRTHPPGRQSLKGQCRVPMSVVSTRGEARQLQARGRFSAYPPPPGRPLQCLPAAPSGCLI